MGQSARGVGIWGILGSDGFADALIPHILRQELSVRLPGVEIGEAANGAGLDCLIVSDVDLLSERGPEHGPLAKTAKSAAPRVVWHAVTISRDPTAEEAQLLAKAAEEVDAISVADWATRDRLAEAGVERSIPVVGQTVLLAPRLFSQELLAKRLDFLKLMGWYPKQTDPLVIEADQGLLSQADAMASMLTNQPETQIVVAEMGGPGDAACAAALAERFPALFRLPRAAGLADHSAAIAHCRAFASTSRRSCLVAAAYGRQYAILDGPEALDAALKAGPSQSTARDQTQLDAFFDQIAEIAAGAAYERGAEPMREDGRLADVEEQLRNLQVAHAARSRRLATERMVFTNHLHKAEAEIARLKEETARLREEISQAQSRIAAAEAAVRAEANARAATEEELVALRATRTFRYTAELRSVYGRLRRITDAPGVEEARPSP